MSLDVSILHGRAKEEFDKSPCLVDSPNEIAECAKSKLSAVGFQVYDVMFLDANVDPAESPDKARFLRLEARYGESPDKHIFTFAILKPGGKYKLLWLQSAVATK